MKGEETKMFEYYVICVKFGTPKELIQVIE